MNPLASAYAQRILLTIFLTSFGIYLLIATITYTPFDPGWTHVSSDTQQVTNASGVAGAWIADFLYGVFGYAASLLPIFVLMEAIQIWWPHSFLNRPFRIAAQFFIVLIVAALFSLHLLQPADTLANASGGIIGFEIGRNLLALMGMILSTIFLVTLLLLMSTFAFGIRWNKTMDTLGKIPGALQELFYRNVPEREAAPDRTLEQHLLVANTAIEPFHHEVHEPETEQNDASAINADDDQLPETVIHAGERWAAKPVNAPLTTDEAVTPTTTASVSLMEQKASDTIDHLAELVQKADHALAETANPATTTSANKPVEPSFDWQDQDLLDELLGSMPKASSSVSLPQSITPVQPVIAPNQPQKLDNTNLPPENLTQTAASIVDPSTRSGLSDQALLEQDDWVAVAPKPVEPYIIPEPVAVVENSLPNLVPIAVAEQGVSTWEVEDLIKEFGQPEDSNVLAATLDDLHELDAPLTDASGRPVSRAMQVIQHRATLSPLPSLELLDLPDPSRKVSYTAEQLERLSKLLEIKLQEFNVKASVVEAQPGPVVTRFELELAPGVKASKVTNISRDLARSMSMASVRVVEVIPGKPYIGIEVPNTSREMVRLIELLETPTYRDPSGLITMAMGKDIAGKPVLTDLSKAPHMLVAGTTGSGKSVAVNAMLLSILLKYTPQQIRLILIDPKQLELASYSDIPHLLTPVVTDMKDAVSALNWSVNEMERRYKLMTFLKVRKIDEFNRKVNEATERGDDLLDPTWKPNDSAVQDRAPRLQTLPSIVIVADEFADMIMQVGKKAEELITRLAQKSRAAGIHLMLATQRPSVDVITGLIKANIPTRVALRVNSKIDSRTILDGGGAEDLLGHGDMLFLAPGKIEPERVHGAFISDDEVNRICDAWRERGSPDYVDDILTPYDEEGGSNRGFETEDGSADRDAMYDQAVQFVLETRKCSASALQRKFSLGYNRAARLIDNMEEAGIISPMGPSGKRDILV